MKLTTLKRMILIFVVLFVAHFVAAAPGYAGPNAGGVLILHWNSEIPYYTHGPAFLDVPLEACELAVVQTPPATSIPNRPNSQRRTWYGYVAFPPGSSPRLKAVSLGITYTPFSISSGVHVEWAATPPGTTEAQTSSPPWPGPNSGDSMVFPTTRTGQINEIFTFAGYGTQGQIFAFRTHPIVPSQFADDALPANLDPVVAFGSLGFGVNGVAPCPCSTCIGACCFLDGSCQLLPNADCVIAGGVWQGDGTVCVPNPCPHPGACCFADCTCRILTASDCANSGGAWLGAGVSCTPNPCPCPAGACCHPDGSCVFVTQSECQTADWQVGVPCDPNPCPPPMGACCFADCACEVMTETACLEADGVWIPGVSCNPRPCPCPPGACCYPDGSCVLTIESDCPTDDWHLEVPCAPNPCPQPTGACCFESGECRIMSRNQCDSEGGVYVGDDVACTPQLCAPVPIERSSWGRIKSQYR